MLGHSEFEAYLSRFAEVFELPWDQTLWAPGIDLICQHGLKTLDAMHVATAQHCGITNLAAVDDDFQRVPNPVCWLVRDPTATL
jgi:predicted nucleic acid-binding protein